MKMTHGLLPQFEYLASTHQVPIDISIHSDAPVEISSRVEVNAAILTNVNDPQISFGFVRRVLPAKAETIVLMPNNPFCMRVNILERDEDFSALQPGKYRYEIKIQVRKKVGDDFKAQELSSDGIVVLE